MLSDRSFTPGFKAHIPRTIPRIFTPDFDASYSFFMISISTRAFILKLIEAFLPCFAKSISLSIMKLILSLAFRGDTRRFSNFGLVYGYSINENTSSTSFVIFAFAVNRAKSV